MTTRYSSRSFLTIGAATLAVLVLTAIPANAEITIVSSYAGLLPGQGGVFVIDLSAVAPLFDVSGADKLVVMTGGRGSGGSIYGKYLTGITYGTTPMVEAVKARNNAVSPNPDGEAVAGIYYLDNPSAETILTISYNAKMDTTSGYTLLALSGTAAGVGPTSATVTGVYPGDTYTSASTSLVTGVSDSLVLAAVAANRHNPAPVSPLINIPDTASTYAAGYEFVPSAGTVTPTFSMAATYTPLVVAAAFAPGAGPRNLTLRVDPVTGVTTLLGDPTRVIAINYYEITSAGHSLDAVNWSSLADQDFEGGGPPNGTGNGWEEAGGSGSHALAEAFLLGNSTIGASASISLGSGYDAFVGAEDLVFTYRTNSGAIVEGLVEYVTSVIAGDANWDGIVDAADYIALKRNFGRATGARYKDGDFDGDHDVDWNDLQTLMGNFGARGVGSAPAIPEPAMLSLMGIGGLALLRRRRAA